MAITIIAICNYEGVANLVANYSIKQVLTLTNTIVKAYLGALFLPTLK